MCGVCQTIQETIEGKNRYFVRELETGYVVIGDYQRIKGYTLFLCKVHATEIHFLERPFRETFLNEMSLVAEAVYNAFGPDKCAHALAYFSQKKGRYSGAGPGLEASEGGNVRRAVPAVR